jgi:hypothetical protein
MFLKLIVVFAILAVVNSSYLVANYYTDTASCASNLSAQAFLPMGKCISIPEIPASLNIKVPVKSLKSSCTQNADGSISTSNKGYATSSSCGGLGVPVKQDIPAGCSNGGLFTCMDDMSPTDSVAAGWPAVGAYFGDSACGANNFDVQAAFAPDTCVTLSGKKGSGSVIATASADSLSVSAWKDATTCDGDATQTYALPLGQCQIVDMPSIQDKQMHYQAVAAFYHLFSTAMDLEVSPELMQWLQNEMVKANGQTMLGGAPPIYSKAGVAGKL